MFRLAWAAIAGSNPGSWAILALGVLVTLCAASGGGAYVMHKMDSAAYTSLQLQYAKSKDAAQTAQIKAQVDFDTRLAEANKRANDNATALALERAKNAQDLHTAIADEEKKNVPLSVCMHMLLPTGVLQHLTR
jgi:hypothetical protein